jgi:sulfite reductase (ferredoxin)
MAELGFVGSSPEAYQVWLGGSPHQTRLAEVYVDKLPISNLETFLEPIFVYFKQKRQPAESFGDFCFRVGLESIRQFTTTYSAASTMTTDTTNEQQEVKPEVTAPSANDEAATAEETAVDPNKIRHRVSLRHEVYIELKAEAERQGKPLVQLATEAIESYLRQVKGEV